MWQSIAIMLVLTGLETVLAHEDALVMWVHEVDQPEYAALLDSIERMLPGETVFDEGRRW